MVRILAKRLLWAAVLLLAGMGAPCRSASMPQSSPETPAIKSPWIYPQPSAVEHRSAKEAKRFEEAWKSFTEGKTKKAQKDWISLLKKHSDSSSLLTALSYIDFMEQEPALAIAKLNAALRADPKYLPAVQTLARYYQSQKDHEKAYRYTATIVELRPDDAQARSDLEELRLLVTDQWIAEAHSARAKAKWQEAEFAYLQAMTVAPELETLPRELGDIYVYEGKWAEAEKSYRRAQPPTGTARARPVVTLKPEAKFATGKAIRSDAITLATGSCAAVSFETPVGKFTATVKTATSGTTWYTPRAWMSVSPEMETLAPVESLRETLA